MILSLIEVLILFVCILISVAYLTVAERKTLAYMQRRIGPNIVGYYGLLMAFADALKLLMKEIIIPREANSPLLIISPIIALISALLTWAVLPFAPGISMIDMNYGMIYILSISSIGVFGTLLAGWSSNSKYALLGSIRSTAQLISYELILTTIFIIIFFFISNTNISLLIDSQFNIYYIIPLLPLSIIYFIASVAETNRPPFDNVEAESELVSGHMTELSASPFVLFYLQEYNNITVMAYINSLLFLGGYIPLYPFNIIIDYILYFINAYIFNNVYIINLIEGIIYSNIYSIKSILLMYTFIWVRASFPRLRYDLLNNLCWVILLPIVFSLLIIIPFILYIMDALPIIYI